MSASNNKWEIAVAVPIKNQYFRYQNRFSATISNISNAVIDLTDLQTDSDSSISNASEVMAAGDRITLKAADGTVSGTTIFSVTDVVTGTDERLRIFTSGNMDNRGFAADDTIVGYGNVVPGGWIAQDMLSVSGFTISRVTGAFDNFGIKLTGAATGSESGFAASKYVGLRQNLDTDYFVSALNYRFGLKYKYSRATETYNGWAYRANMVADSTTNTIYIHDGTSAAVNSWTSKSTAVSITDSSVSSWYIHIYLFALLGELYDQSYGYLDEVYLEHVYNSVAGQTIYGNTAANSDDDTNIGYYEIDGWAEEGSVSWREIEQDSEVGLVNKGVEWYDPTGYGERNTKYEITAKFVNISTDVWDKLEALKRIQKNGHKLNLHPYLDELPSVLTGKMYIEGVDYTYWDLGYVSFDFKFRES